MKGGDGARPAPAGRSSAGGGGTAGGDERRPLGVLFVYSWDILLAIGAFLGALTAFSGSIAVGARQIDVPLPVQIFYALSAASYCAALIIIATLLTRRQRWVWRAQVAILSFAIVIAAVSLLTGGVVTTHGVDVTPLLASLILMGLDTLAICVMADRRVASWYSGPGSVPLYANATIGFWVASSAAIIVFQSFR